MAQINSLKTETKFKKTEIGEIPVDWEVLTLQEISDEIYRYPTYYNIEYADKGVPEVRGELIRPNGTLEKDLSKYRLISYETASKFPRTSLKEGDFVISVRGTMGKVAIVPKLLEGANITANLIRISPDRKKISPLFFHQLLLSDKFQKKLNIISSSTTIKTIKAPELKMFEFPIPSLPEQKKIAEILATVDEAIERKKKVIEKTKELKKSLMQELLTRGICHKKFKKTEIGEIPEEWDMVKIEDCCEILDSKRIPLNDQERRHMKGEYPYYGANGLIGRINAYIFDDDLILMAEDGGYFDEYKTRPIAYLVSGKCWVNNHAHVLKSKKGWVREWIFYSLVHKNILPYIGGGTRSKLNQKELRAIPIPTPPYHEQKKIAEILSNSDESIEKDIAHKERLEEIKKGLMQVLLTGKLRVNIKGLVSK